MSNYKQYNTKWAKLPYPRAPWYIRECGCGEVAIANAINQSSRYKGETPKTILPYCKQLPHRMAMGLIGQLRRL